jgi:hypothetical protein
LELTIWRVAQKSLAFSDLAGNCFLPSLFPKANFIVKKALTARKASSQGLQSSDYFVRKAIMKFPKKLACINLFK